ncbi:MAG: hypothetical protein M1130_00040 [Actinobacteria bacterium]|nr:hypothetical protein [Actinomycetota bacterium]
MSPAEKATETITSILNKYADQIELLDIIDIVDSLRIIMEAVTQEE